MVSYALDHLVQPDDQTVVGPIQDDEALLLFALARCMRIRTVLELGGLDGYSARNFCRAVGPDGQVFTVDLKPVAPVAPNHRTMAMDVGALTRADIGGAELDLVFFDCHDFDAQMALFHRLTAEGAITHRTLLALHDTNLHPVKMADWVYPLDGGGFVHQPVERRMVNALKAEGYDAVMLHTPLDRHDATLPMRHGLTLMQRFAPLAT